MHPASHHNLICRRTLDGRIGVWHLKDGRWYIWPAKTDTLTMHRHLREARERLTAKHKATLNKSITKRGWFK